jgi:hypothetical protein
MILERLIKPPSPMYIGCVALMFYHVSDAIARGRVADQTVNGRYRRGFIPGKLSKHEKFGIENWWFKLHRLKSMQLNPLAGRITLGFTRCANPRMDGRYLPSFCTISKAFATC